jgi:hypothetical protein
MMNKSIFLIALICSAPALLQSASSDDNIKLIPDEKVGIVRLVGESKTQYFLDIVLPLNLKTGCKECSLPGNMYKTNVKVPIRDGFQFFDSKGIIGSIVVKEIPLKFWCENDGGIQFRPTVRIRINKDKISRRFKIKSDLNGIVAFAKIVSSKDRTNLIPLKLKPDYKLLGDINGDGFVDAAIEVSIDDLSGCDPPGDPKKYISLEVGNNSYPLRCCGP